MTVETPVHTLADHALAGRDLVAETAGVVSVEPPQAMVSLRAPAAVAAALDLPTRANTWLASDRGRIVWLGPDEWLVTEPATTSRTGLDLETSLREVLTPHGGTAVEVSAQRLVLRLSGPYARKVLAKGCSIDVHPRTFGPHAAAQTTLGQAGVVLLSLGSTGDEFAVVVRASFARYLADWLVDATLEFRS